MKNNQQDTILKINDLEDLYRTDPEGFKTLSRQLIAETIEKFPPESQAKAYGLQLRIDADLSHYKDPVARMNRMVEIFWNGVDRFRVAIDDPDELIRQQNEKQGKPASIIPFPGRDGRLH